MRLFVLFIIATFHTLSAFATDKEPALIERQSVINSSVWHWESIEELEDASDGATLGELHALGQEIIIQAKGTALFKIPKDYWVKLISSNSHLVNNKIKPNLWYSNGNGLFIPAPLQFHSDKNELNDKKIYPKTKQWVMAPPLNNNLLLMLTNTSEDTIRWILSRAQPIEIKERKTYSDIVYGQENIPTWHLETNPRKHIQLNKLIKNQFFSVDLQGPGEWKMETRLLIDSWQPWKRFINLNLKLNGSDWHDWRLHPSIDDSRLLVTGQCERLTSRPETLNITLPSGSHRLSFTAPQSMSVRVNKVNDNPFIFMHNQLKEKNTHNKMVSFDSTLAIPDYDDTLLAEYLSGTLKKQSMRNNKNKNNSVEQQLRINKTIKLINQRYQVWRPISINSASLQQKSAWLIDTRQRNNNESTDRYVSNVEGLERKQKILLKLDPGKIVELHSPGKQNKNILKLSFPMTNTPFDLTLTNRHGKKTVWYWRPLLVNEDDLDIVSGADFSVLTNGSTFSRKNALATASGSIILAQEDFPISLSHNSGKGLWFSPFYRDAITFSLDEKTWLRALKQFGVDNMLALLLQPNRSIRLQKSDQSSSANIANVNSLKDLVLQDWKPLRRWLTSYQHLWSQGLTSSKFDKTPLRHEPLASLIKRLSHQKDYALLSKTLKGMAIKDPDPNRRENALRWLFNYYQTNQDISNLSAYHSWRFKQNPNQYLPTLANWLLSQGQSKMALRLFELTKTLNHHLPYQHAKLQQAWHFGQSNTSPLLYVWHALWHQDWQKAEEHSEDLDKNNPWHRFLNTIPDNKNPANWLTWAKQSPSTSIHQGKHKGIIVHDELRVPISISPTKSTGRVQLYQHQRELYFQMALAQTASPVQYSVIGPIEMQISIRLKHENNTLQPPLNDWIEINNNGSKKWIPIINSKASSGLTLLSNSENLPGNSHSSTLSLGPGLHHLSIRPMIHTAFVSAKVLSHPLLSNLVKSIQGSALSQSTSLSNYTDKSTNTKLSKQLLSTETILNNIDVTSLQFCNDNIDNERPQNYNRSNLKWALANTSSNWHIRHSLSRLSQSLVTYMVLNTANKNSDDINDVEQHLLMGLWHWPKVKPQEKSQWLAQANSLAQPYIKHNRIKTLISKLNEHSFFQPVDMVVASAGNRRSNTSDNSEYIAEREKLIWSGKAAEGERLHGHNKLGFITRFKTKTRIRLKFSLARYPYQYTHTGNVKISRNGKTIKTVNLDTLKHTTNIRVPAGQQKVAITLIDPSQDQWLYVKAQAYLNEKWQPLLKPIYKRYDVATHQQPLELYFDEPSWLRIDEFSHGKVKHRYQYQAHSGSLLLKPNERQEQAMLRVMSLKQNILNNDLKPLNIANDSETISHNPRPSQGGAILSMKELASKKLTIESARLKNTQNHTNGAYVRYQTRRDFDSDITGSDNEKFVEGGWQYRKKLDCLSCFWRHDLFAREHSRNNISILGSHQWLQGAWPKSSWRWQLKQSLFIQTTDNTPFKWFATGILKQNHDINETLKHGYQFHIFARHLSEGNPAFSTDNDIYSQYQVNHRWGLRFEKTMSGRPWLDSFWSSHIRIVSNELDSSIKAEYVQVGIGWRQYYKPLELGLNYHYRNYLKDEDRLHVVEKPNLAINLSYWQKINQDDALQWKLRLTNDLDRNEYGITLETSWNFSHGRGLTDYRSAESAFYRLRQRDISGHQPSRTNNE